MRVTDPEVRDRERTGGSGLGIIVGILLVILGLIAIARPLYATLASTLVFGWLFIFAGIAQIIYAFGSREQVSLFGNCCWVSFTLGLVLLCYPTFYLERLPSR